MTQIKHLIFLSDGLKLTGTLYSPTSKKVSPGILFIHGAGQSSRKRYFELQSFLAKKGFASFSFDVRGVGESEGAFVDGSLNNRFRDAEQALTTFIASGVVDSNRLAIGGNSMGGHIAVRMADKHPELKALMLGCAAAYGQEAEDKKLDETFTNVLRRENSWADSVVPSLLKNYHGKVCAVYGESDHVIPKEVQAIFLDRARKGAQAHILKHTGHNLLVPHDQNEEKATLKLYRLVAKFLKSAL